MRRLFRTVSWLLLLTLASCEKTISFRPIRQSQKLVVEAIIENDAYPVVYLSRSLDFFSNISVQALSESFVHNATVTISDGSRSQILKENFRPVQNDYGVYYYTSDPASGAFGGALNRNYTLTITADGEQYSATTTIPALTKRIESLSYETNVDRDDTTKVSLFARITDPPGLGNYIRYFTRVGGGPFLPGFNSVFDDQVIDGKTYTVQVEQGVDRNQDIDQENYPFFHRGDTISVKFCNIDKSTFDFWRTMEYSYSSIGNPFSSPTKVTGNISNGALGYFGGYAVQYANIILPQ